MVSFPGPGSLELLLLSSDTCDFDLIVIGNGSAGDNIARTLGRKGLRVAIVEKTHLGGECLNDGCVPSKALIDISKRAREHGLSWDEVVARVHAIQLQVRGTDPNGNFGKDGIELFWGEARFRAATHRSGELDGRSFAHGPSTLHSRSLSCPKYLDKNSLQDAQGG